ncbi:MAG: hypothetical protein LUH04_05175, partial [Clostridium sp.]|nr:hypothetical protein [Clostridium sp.]
RRFSHVGAADQGDKARFLLCVLLHIALLFYGRPANGGGRPFYLNSLNSTTADAGRPLRSAIARGLRRQTVTSRVRRL